MTTELTSRKRINAKRIWNRTLSIERTAERLEVDVEIVRTFLLAEHPNVAKGQPIPAYSYTGPKSQARRTPSLPTLKCLAEADV